MTNIESTLYNLLKDGVTPDDLTKALNDAQRTIDKEQEEQKEKEAKEAERKNKIKEAREKAAIAITDYYEALDLLEDKKSKEDCIKATTKQLNDIETLFEGLMEDSDLKEIITLLSKY